MIPGLKNAGIARLGACTATPTSISPILLARRCDSRDHWLALSPARSPAGEGYIESAAIGLLRVASAAAERLGLSLSASSRNHAFRALLNHITGGHIVF